MAEMKQLAERMKRGEQEAYAEFLVHFGGVCYRFLRRKGLSDADARDLSCTIVTDIALRVGKYKPRPDVGFSAWVCRVMHNEYVKWLRRHHAEDELPADPVWPGEAGTIEEDAECATAVQDALKSLSDVGRRVIELRYRGCRTPEFQEIADELNSSGGEVFSADRVRLVHFRGRKKLEELLRADPRMADRIARLEGSMGKKTAEGK